MFTIRPAAKNGSSNGNGLLRKNGDGNGHNGNGHNGNGNGKGGKIETVLGPQRRAEQRQRDVEKRPPPVSAQRPGCGL